MRAQAVAEDGVDIVVGQAGIEQFADHEARAACGLEVVDVGVAVRVDARQQRHDAGEFIEIVPVDDDAGRLGDGHQVQRVVGRATGGEQAGQRVDDTFFVDDMAHWHVIATLLADFHGALRGRYGQRGAQFRARRNECGTRQVQAHDFHQHLVAVGGAVERTGAGAVVGLGFPFQQFFTRGLAQCVTLAHRGFFLVRDAGGHWSCGYEHGRNVAEVQRADQQARHDLVAHAKVQGGIKHIVRQRDRRAHGDGVARKQRQFHARLALRHAVAHGGRAACKLGHGADFAHGILDDGREVFERLVCRQHVVIGRHDRHRRLAVFAQFQLVVGGKGRETVGQVGTGQCAALYALDARRIHMGEVGRARWRATVDDALGNAFNYGMKRHGTVPCV